MVNFSKFSLGNGLRILIHEDRSTPLIAMNILYDVGSRDEDPASTGLAHLFEHLMFGGTPGIPDFDTPLQLAGGENNAFTSSDITNYYITVPAQNIETAFWLESDRMRCLDFSETSLGIQKNVVVEEFNQRYLNYPYGDAQLLLKPLAYKTHPYRWPTIGIDPSHIRNVELDSIKDFFFSHYAPNNAILALAGNISPDEGLRLAEKWFGSIESRDIRPRNLPSEAEQTAERRLEVERDVPATAIYKAWHIGSRTQNDFYVCDLITDILAGGESGRLFNTLVRKKKLFSEIDAYITAEIDPGLLIISGRLMNESAPEEADEAIIKLIGDLRTKPVPESELEKVKDKYESSNIYLRTSILGKAMNLAYYELLGDPDLINKETGIYCKGNQKMVREIAGKYLTCLNCSTLFYNSSRQK
jgi:zinc protease